MSLVSSGRSFKFCTAGKTFTSIKSARARALMSLINVLSADGIAINNVVAPVRARAWANWSRPPSTGTPEILNRCVSGLSSRNPTGK